MSLNLALLIGRLGKDPELRYAASGTAICKFSIAVDVPKKDENKQLPDWFNIVAFGKTGENCAQYLTKGREVFIEGQVKTRSYEDKGGNKRYVTEIWASRIQFLGGGKDKEKHADDTLKDDDATDSDDEEAPF